MPKPSLRLRISKQQSVPAAPNPTKPSPEATFLPLTSLLNLPVTTPTLASPPPVSFRGSTITTHTETCNITPTPMDNRSPPTTTTTTEASLGIHRGAIDNTAITTQPPSEVMTKVRGVLDSIGVSVEPESTFRFRCIRPSQSVSSGSDVVSSTFEGSSDSNTLGVAAPPAVVIYAGDPSRDPAGEVRFSVELTRLVGLNDTYCLDIRRLKGNLRSYQFLYETIRNRTHLTA